ncbi:hypothetical protein OPT61_g7083 [Boeremia exigua]|uniref:Uncharacterized protein n=1 Tax=Boeremia exigua TaxID=749465 RepID=A0ACC2I4M3_9PLEO|nr:hypothetical protein OPT61_g7083 [Boeremia exigua]
MPYSRIFTPRTFTLITAMSLGGGYLMIKSKALAEQQRERGVGDYSVTVDRRRDLMTSNNQIYEHVIKINQISLSGFMSIRKLEDRFAPTVLVSRLEHPTHGFGGFGLTCTRSGGAIVLMYSTVESLRPTADASASQVRAFCTALPRLSAVITSAQTVWRGHRPAKLTMYGPVDSTLTFSVNDMAKSAGYYNVDDFNKYKKTQGRCLPPRINVLAAATHIQALLDAKKLTYGFMGGLPMLCLGYKREMPDLHIAYDAREFERLKAKLETDRRIRIQTGLNSLLPFKILIWTGPEFKDQGCSVSASIEMDFVPSGSYGTPTSSDLAHTTILLGLKTASGKQMIFKSLNLYYLVATLLSYCKSRDLLWDPRKDILYLCKNETEEIQRLSARLNKKEVKELFLGTPFFSRLNIDDQRLCYRVLLATEPPPTMAITPPAPQAKMDETERNADARSSRLRYRNTSEQRSSSSGKSDRPQLQSTEHLQDTGRLSYIKGVQCVKSAKPQAVSAAKATKEARKSMPNLLADYNAPNSHALAQDNSRASVPEQAQAIPQARNVRSRPHSSGPHPVHVSSKLEYGAGFRPAYMESRRDTDNANEVFELAHVTTTSSVDSSKTDPAGALVGGIQSQKGSIHVVSPEWEQKPHQQYFEETVAPSRGRLHVVSPEGLYGGVEVAQEAKRVHTAGKRHHSAPPVETQPAPVFELDATALNVTFFAELPADSIVPSPIEQHILQEDELSGLQTVKPLNVHKTIAPTEPGFLPASLVVGRPGMHAHRSSLSHPTSTDELSENFSTRQTNAYRYSAYTLPSSEGPKASPKEASAPAYLPYRPVVETFGLSRTDSASSMYSPGHKRDASDASTASHDSSKLAREYQELLDFEAGYGSD